MDDVSLDPFWRTEYTLRQAQSLLPPPFNAPGQQRGVAGGILRGTVGEFEEFMYHGELELAWDALADLAEREGAAVECWEALFAAAQLMGLREQEARALRFAAGEEPAALIAMIQVRHTIELLRELEWLQCTGCPPKTPYTHRESCPAAQTWRLANYFAVRLMDSEGDTGRRR